MVHMGHCTHLRVRPVGRQISKRTAARIARTTINCAIAENNQGDLPIVIEAEVQEEIDEKPAEEEEEDEEVEEEKLRSIAELQAIDYASFETVR